MNAGLHEELELQELLHFKSLSLTKSSMMQAFVSDSSLKQLMKSDTDTTLEHVQELTRLLERTKEI
jgi:similar to spore coat protein